MPPSKCRIHLKEFGKIYGVAFLEYASKNSVNVCEEFENLQKQDADYIRASFGLYVQGIRATSTNKRYHGWQSSEHGGKYKDCYVFKRGQIRIYGFLINHEVNKRFQLCVLAEMAAKKGQLTDKAILGRMVELAMDEDVFEEVGRVVKALEGMRSHE